MSILFDEIWMQKFKDEWNRDRHLSQSLKTITFTANIAYGFPDEDKPRAVIYVKDGQVIDAGPYKNQNLNWDLRAREKHWLDWFSREVGKASLGLAYSTGKLKFLSGDYKGMIKNPSLIQPFIKSFSVMARI